MVKSSATSVLGTSVETAEITDNAVTGAKMAAGSWEFIGSVTANAGDTTIAISSIAAGFKALWFEYEFELQTSSATMDIRFNDDATASAYEKSGVREAITTVTGIQKIDNAIEITGSVPQGEHCFGNAWVHNTSADIQKSFVTLQTLEDGNDDMEFTGAGGDWDLGTDAEIDKISLVRTAGTGTLVRGTLYVWGHR